MSKRLFQIGVLGAASVLAAASSYCAALTYWRAHYSEDVPAFFLSDPVIKVAREGDALGLGKKVSASPEDLEADARAALRIDALDPAAFFVLGKAKILGRQGDGLAEFEAAEKISRRFTPVELELLRMSAAKGDLAGAIRHLDRAVSVAPKLGDEFLPQFAPSLADPSVAAAFLPYAYRPWFSQFIRAGIDAHVSPLVINGLIGAAEKARGPEGMGDLRSALFSETVKRGDFLSAVTLMTRLAKDKREALGRFGFSKGNSDPSLAPMGWTLVNDTTKSASVDDKGVLAVSIGADLTGEIAERVTLISPGFYVLSQRITYDPAEPKAGLIWEMRCEGEEGAPQWRQPMPLRNGAIVYQSAITVPETCPIQHWRLFALGASGQAESRASLDQMTVAVK